MRNVVRTLRLGRETRWWSAMNPASQSTGIRDRGDGSPGDLPYTIQLPPDFSCVVSIIDSGWVSYELPAKLPTGGRSM